MADRSDFRDWIDDQPDPQWPLMPLTHVTKAFTARDIIREGKVSPSEAGPLKVPLAYFFYGRPAFRVSGDGSIKVGATCPVCFVFDPEIIKRAHAIHAFDTGAFGKRMYSHVMMDEMNVTDFALGADPSAPNKLISAAFGSQEAYFEGDLSRAASPESAPVWNFLAQAYLQLLISPGRNEPDDRVGAIEVTFADPVLLADNLYAVIVPHILWTDDDPAPWLKELREAQVEILPYKFIPGKSPEHYYGLIESEVRSLLEDLKLI
ncbi:hypothetical protein [Brevundimonas intermedia]|uniref:hypothetical protein n=1 Tax=Brevundimonas intermedia TaxID=74315 RepID=UPI003209420D